MDAEAYLRERAALVDRRLEALVPDPAEPPTELHRAMRHLLFPGGKRLRPALAFAGCEAAGAPAERALPAAAAVELVHTYSLVHDDLPCMDDDAERRGRPAVHVAFGEATAVLAGDALLALAFEALAEAEGPAEPARAALLALARAAGSRALVGGQADDLAAVRTRPDAAGVESIHRRKAAALLGAAVGAGARLGGAGDALLERLERFAERVGVAFQIADDLLDAGGPEGEAASLVRALGREGARARAAALLEQALAEIEPLGEPAEPLRELARFAVGRER